MFRTNDNINETTTAGGFKLLRHFTYTAVISIAVAAILLGGFYKQFIHTQFIDDAQQHHLEIARLYRNFIWPIYGNFLLKIDDESINEITDTLLYTGLHNGVKSEIKNSHVLKLKIFNRQGLTVYSSDPAQIGQMKKDYPGFLSAINGEVSSDLSFRESFNTGEQREAVKNKHIYSSYLPVFDDFEENNVIAAIELYSDVTHLVEEARSTGAKLMLITFLVMFALFSVLLINIKRAEGRIRQQEKIEGKLKEQAVWQANHDALTQLPNRACFDDLLVKNLTSIANTNQTIALMYIDLDHFKPINDAHGHQSGDLVLQQVARRIQTALPTESVVARLGGDEFTAFFIVDKRNANVAFQADKVLEALALPFKLADAECVLSASIGITYCDNPDIGTNTLIAQADAAMYISKKSGRGTASTYNDELKNKAA